jgi:hypothetical protein
MHDPPPQPERDPPPAPSEPIDPPMHDPVPNPPPVRDPPPQPEQSRTERAQTATSASEPLLALLRELASFCRQTHGFRAGVEFSAENRLESAPRTALGRERGGGFLELI